MNVPVLVAGSLALLGAGIHGVAGEALVLRRLSPGMLPPSPFGGSGMTKAMIGAAWHMTTVLSPQASRCWPGGERSEGSDQSRGLWSQGPLLVEWGRL